MVVETIKENLTLLIMCSYVFLIGIGIGASITDIINKWRK